MAKGWVFLGSGLGPSIDIDMGFPILYPHNSSSKSCCPASRTERKVLEQDFTGYFDNDNSSYSDGSKHDDHDVDDFYSFYVSDDMYANDQTFNNEDELEVNADVPTEVAASQVGSRRVDKEPIKIGRAHV